MADGYRMLFIFCHVKMTTRDFDSLIDAPAFVALANRTQDFEPFKVMGIRSKELVHSRVLATFLNKQERHGLGADFLNAFVRALARPDSNLFSGDRLDADELLGVMAPSAHSLVYRELDFIDLVVVFPAQRLVIGIENKVHAGEQKAQLARYQEALRMRFKGYRHALVFLTRSGRNPTTANISDRMPIYCMDYGQVTGMLKRCKESPNLVTTAAIFIDQFVDHIERYMTASSQAKELCWQLFTEHEKAYKDIYDHYKYCVARKVKSAFSSIADRLTTDPVFGIDPALIEITPRQVENDKHVVYYDLDVRMHSWPKGVGVLIYKRIAFSVFPYVREADIANLRANCLLPMSPSTAKGWPGYRYFCADQALDTVRTVREQGNELTPGDVDQALSLAAGYMRTISQALEAQSFVSDVHREFADEQAASSS